MAPKGVEIVSQGAQSSLKIDLLSLPPPADAFQADWYASEALAGSARFLFGKMSAGRKHLAGVVEITMATFALKYVNESLEHVSTLPSNEGRTFAQTLGLFLQTSGLGKVESNMAQLPELVVPGVTKEASFVATLAVLSFSENDASIALFRIVPGAEARVRRQQDVESAVAPLVRIDTTAPILQAFCQDVRSLLGIT